MDEIGQKEVALQQLQALSTQPPLLAAYHDVGGWFADLIHWFIACSKLKDALTIEQLNNEEGINP